MPSKSRSDFHEEIARLKGQGRLDDADVVAREAQSQFPDELGWQAERAWIAFDRQDFTGSIQLWRGLREKCDDPDISFLLGEGVACHRAGLLDEAEEVYTQALEKFPGHQQLLIDFAWNAEARGDRQAALLRWQKVKAQSPDRPEAYRRMAIGLFDEGRFDEAAAVLEEGMERLAEQEDLFVDYAWQAEWRGNPGEALKRWERVKLSFPHRPEGYSEAARILMDRGRLEDAKVVLAPSLRMFPDDPQILEINGWLATRQRAVQTADEIWSEFRKRFPDKTAGYLGWAAVLRAEGRLQEAEKILTEAEQHSLSDVWIALELAHILTDRCDWQNALLRWCRVAQDFPHMPEPYEGLIKTLVAVGKMEEARAVFLAGEKLIAKTLHADIVSLSLAGSLFDADMVNSRAAALVERYPDKPEGYVVAGELLRKQGQLEEAENFIRAALDKFPDHLELDVEFAQTISAQRDWARALPLWTKLGDRNPGNGSIRTAIADCLWKARQDQAALFVEGQSQAAGFEIPASLLKMVGNDHQEELRDLLMQFECIGTTCEFGLVQRRFGAEPISLLRWSSTTPEDLATALDHDLDGVGDVDHTIIEVANGEYLTRDKRYYMLSHTFTLAASEALESFTAAQCGRLQYLRRKFLSDLKATRKIYVYVADSKDTVTDEEAILLHQALRRHAQEARLLCVRLEEPDAAAGECREIRPGLFIGFLDRLSTIDISFDRWISLCRQALSFSAGHEPK